MDASERLTIQALKEHDKVHPKFKAMTKTPTSVTSSSKELKEGEVKLVKDGSNGRRGRMLSNSDAHSKKSDAPAKKPSGMTFFRIVAATRAWQRLAKKKRQAAPVKPTVKFENTFKLGPDVGKLFSVAKAEDVLRESFDSRLHNVKYHPERSKSLATDLATVIKGRIKAMDAPRYKFVCSVVIIENKDQGMQISSRCIWNTDTDNYATYKYSNASLIAIGYVHAVYYE